MTTQLSRQVFLRGALGVAAAAMLSSCQSTTATPPLATPGPGNPSTPPSRTDWNALDDAIDGHILLPADDGYPAAKTVFNARFADATPTAVVTVQSAEDVQKALAFAVTNGLTVTARSGGHSYVGASTANGTMVVDLREVPGGIVCDDDTALATISAAAEIDSVQQTLDTSGRSIPTGSCPSVGVAGLTLGGGLGADARRYGLTCDALLSASVVLPSGEAVTATADDHADLYWALRGGGGPALGIVTSFTFQTFPTTDRDVVTLTFPEHAAARVIQGWHDWLTAADRTVWGMVNLTVGPDPARCSVILATPPGDGPGLADALVAAMGVPSVGRTIRTFDHLAFVNYFSGGADAVRPRAFVAGSDIVEQMTPAAAQSIVAATAAWPRRFGSATAVIESLDGAIRDVEPDASAFPWRRHDACVQWYVETPTPPIVDAGNAWLTAAHAAMGSNSVGGYLNYLEPSTPAARYLGANLPRLASVRQRYDSGAVMYSSLMP